MFDSTLLMRLLCVSITRFGLLVVPEVWSIMVTSSSVPTFLMASDLFMKFFSLFIISMLSFSRNKSVVCPKMSWKKCEDGKYRRRTSVKTLVPIPLWSHVLYLSGKKSSYLPRNRSWNR